MPATSEARSEWEVKALQGYAEAAEQADAMAEEILAIGGETTSARDFFLAMYAYDLDASPQPAYTISTPAAFVFHSISVLGSDAEWIRKSYEEVKGNLFKLDRQSPRGTGEPDYADTLLWVPPETHAPVTYNIRRRSLDKAQPDFEPAEGYVGGAVLDAFSVHTSIRTGRVRTTPIQIPVLHDLWRPQRRPVYVGFEIGGSYQRLPKAVGLTALLAAEKKAPHPDSLHAALAIGELGLAQLRLAEEQDT